MIRFFLTFLAFCAFTPAWAAPCGDVAGLRLLVSSNNDRDPADFQPADCSEDFAAKVSLALENMANLPMLERGPEDLDFNFINLPPIEFVRARAKRLVLNLNPKSSHCVAGVVAYVIESRSKTFFLCPYAGTLPSTVIQSNIIHESRHLDGPEFKGELGPNHPKLDQSYPHATCKKGVFAGYDACDEDMKNGGSYSIQTEFYLKIAATKALPKEIRDIARVAAITFLMDHFSEIPVPYKTGALLLSEDGVLYFYDGVAAEEIRRDISHQNIVAIRNLPTLLNRETGQVTNFWGSAEVPAPGSFSKLFGKFTPRERNEILDVYYGGLKACFLFTTHVYCQIGNDSVSLRFPPEIEPLQLNILSGMGDVVSVIDKKGDQYFLPLKKFANEWSVEDLGKNIHLRGFQSVALIAGHFNAGIMPDGTLVQWQQSEGLENYKAVSGFAGRRFKKIMGPFIWSDRLQKI